jgi:hypothetical protein
VKIRKPVALNKGATAAKKKMLGKRNGKSSGGGVQLPPMINNVPVVHTTFRYYIQSSSAPVSVSMQDVFGACGGISTSSVGFKPWASSFKIKKIRAWPAESATSDAEDIALNWNTGFTGQVKDEIKSADVPRGVTVTKMVEFKPPAKSLCGDWVLATAPNLTSNLFTLVGQPGTIIDLHISFTLVGAIQAGTITTASATTGVATYLALDGASSNTVIPAHLPTTN